VIVEGEFLSKWEKKGAQEKLGSGDSVVKKFNSDKEKKGMGGRKKRGKKAD